MGRTSTIAAGLAAAWLALGAGGCGPPEEPPANTAPAISNLVYQPAHVGTGEQFTVMASVDYVDADGDAHFLHVEFTMPDDSTLTLDPLDIEDAAGVTEGAADFLIRANVQEAADYPFVVWMRDDKDILSNRLSGSLEAG